MGYEIIFKYHPQEEDGNYNKEETKELKKKVGDPYDDVPLEKLAKIVMSQRARRDILIIDAEIYEYKKTKINFKETKGGIVIKHKKFLLDDESNIIVQEVNDTPQQPTQVPQVNGNGNHMMVPATAALPANKVNLIAPTGRPIKWVALDPSDANMAKVKRAGLAFVVDKRYPVFSEIPSKQFGINIYTMLDENKREVNVIDEYFVNADQKMVQGFYSAVDKETAPRLVGDYEEDKKMPMPNIRGF